MSTGTIHSCGTHLTPTKGAQPITQHVSATRSLNSDLVLAMKKKLKKNRSRNRNSIDTMLSVTHKDS
jgi:hypothetical protein